MTDPILFAIAKAGGYKIYRDLVIIENLKNNNYEMKKAKERLRYHLKKRK